MNTKNTGIKKGIKSIQLMLLTFLLPGMMAFSQTPQSANTKVNSAVKTINPVVVLQPNSAPANAPNAATERPASSLITDGKEPAALKGYITWVDPDTKRKHLIQARRVSTGRFEYTEQYPSIVVYFTGDKNVTFSGSYNPDGSSYYIPVDSLGHDIPIGTTWTATNHPAAFKYNIRLVADINYQGDPSVMEDRKSIRYNPNRNKFYDIQVLTKYGTLVANSNGTLRDFYDGWDIHNEDFPNIRNAPMIQKRRPAKFNDLPDL